MPSGTDAARNKAPRTPDGQPDLQGFWSNSTYVPLERPNGVTKAFYTPEEAGRDQAGAPARKAQTEPGTVDDVHYDFSQFGLDRSQAHGRRNLRTSLIVDPPDGKIPPMTEEGGGGCRAGRGRRERRPLGLRRKQSARRPMPDHGGPRAADDGCRLQQQLPHRAGAGLRDDPHRDDPRRARHPLDGRPPPTRGAPVDGHLARAVGRRHARRRDHQLQRQESVQGLDAST